MENIHPNAFIHETAVADLPCVIGEGTQIWHFSHILKECSIGRDCTLGQNVMVGTGVVIGDQCKIQNNVSVYQGVILDDGVFCGPGVVFTNVLNPRAEIEKKDEFKPTFVRRGATIGANATIVCGVTIGEYAFVGAGAVVTKDVPDHAMMVGNPAYNIGYACKCGEKLTKQAGKKLQCAVCGFEYELNAFSAATNS